MGRFIEEEEEEEFEESGSFETEEDDDFAESSSDEVEPDIFSDRNRMRQYTDRRRRIEELRERSRLRDELGMYDDDFGY